MYCTVKSLLIENMPFIKIIKLNSIFTCQNIHFQYTFLSTLPTHRKKQIKILFDSFIEYIYVLERRCV